MRIKNGADYVFIDKTPKGYKVYTKEKTIITTQSLTKADELFEKELKQWKK